MKKILFVANVAKEHIIKFHIPSIDKFKSAGWQVDVACSGEEKVPFCDNQFVTSWKRSPFNLNIFKGIHELKNIIERSEYDVVYCHTPVGGVVARLASLKARKRGTRVVYFAHGFHFYKGAPLVNWLIYYPIEKILAKFTDAVITINDEDFKNAKQKLKVKEVYKINGIGIKTAAFSEFSKDVSRIKIREELNIPQNANVLIYLAELIPNKNQGMLLDTLKNVLKKHKNTFLLLVGPDHNDGKFQKYSETLGVVENVRFTGWRADKSELYSAADICVASSIREGFGINLVEALASGLPVVATYNRGHSTIIRDGIEGYLVNIGDSVEMAQKVCQIIENNQLIGISSEELLKYDESVIVEEIINYVSK